MADLSIQQIADAWVAAGGDPGKRDWACAIALAESGGNPRAISLSGDYGLYQINTSNWPAFGLSIGNVFDVSVNTKVAISLSRNGTDWGDWCTAVAPGVPCGSVRPLPIPQAGSPANIKIVAVRQVLATPQQDVPGPTGGSNANSFATAWGQLTTYAREGAQAHWQGLEDVYQALGSVFPPM